MALTTPIGLERARELRTHESASEIRLWERLRGRRLAGLKSVRQLPVGPYIADFTCRELKLIVEVDGVTHSTNAEIAYDERRSTFLASKGYKVVRVWSTDVFNNLDGVCESILHAAGRM